MSLVMSIMMASVLEVFYRTFDVKWNLKSAVRALRECPHLRIEIWGTRFCGVNLGVRHPPSDGSRFRATFLIAAEVFRNSSGRNYFFSLDLQLVDKDSDEDVPHTLR
jgi:hypothetical protein